MKSCAVFAVLFEPIALQVSPLAEVICAARGEWWTHEFGECPTGPVTRHAESVTEFRASRDTESRTSVVTYCGGQSATSSQCVGRGTRRQDRRP